MANYRKIWEDANGPIPKDEEGRSYDIHHIDGNRKNNSIDNLVCISIQEHLEIHINQGDWMAASLISDRLGKVFSGYKLSEETVQKRVQTRKERGYRHSEETKQKMRKKKSKPSKQIGVAKPPRSKEHCQKIRESKLGKNLSEEHKQKIGEGSRGRKLSEDTKQKMKDKVITQEFRDKMRDLRKGSKMSVESIQKRTETRRLNKLKKLGSQK